MGTVPSVFLCDAVQFLNLIALFSSLRHISRHWRQYPPREQGLATLHYHRLPGLRGRLRKQTHQLIRRQHQQTEHQVRHHFIVPAYPDGRAAKFILQPAVGAFRLRALFVALRFRRREWPFLAATRIVID